MNKCDICLWDCGSNEELEDCDYYHPIEENEELDAEYIEVMRIEFFKEWYSYTNGWN